MNWRVDVEDSVTTQNGNLGLDPFSQLDESASGAGQCESDETDVPGVVLLRGESERESSLVIDIASVSESRLSRRSAMDSLCRPYSLCDVLPGRLEDGLDGDLSMLLGWVELIDVRVLSDESDWRDTSSERALESGSPSAVSAVDDRLAWRLLENGDVRWRTMLVVLRRSAAASRM
jgi:hypothetical protein